MDERAINLEALRQSEAKFRSLFESNVLPICFWHANGLVTDANDAYLRVMGFTRPEMESGALNFKQVTPPDQSHLDNSALEELREGGICTPFEKEYVLRDGRRAPVLVFAATIPGHTDRGVAVVLDVSERRRAQQAIEQSERQFRNIYESATVMIMEADFTEIKGRIDAVKATGVKDFSRYVAEHPEFVAETIGRLKMLDANDAAIALMQARDKRQFIDCIGEIFIDETNEVFARELVALAEGRPEFRSEIEVRTFKGERRTTLFTIAFPPSAPIERVVICAIDMTEQRESQAALRELNARLIHAHEEERRRLAREMHDDLTQRLAVLSIECGQLELQLRATGNGAAEKVRDMTEQMVKLSGDVHALSRQLHPSILDDLGLVEAIESECQTFGQREGIRVTFQARKLREPLPKDVALSLYRIMQEGLRNAVRHGRAEHVRVGLSAQPEAVVLTIEDSGVGFDPQQPRRKLGLGLASMHERARLIQAELEIHSEPGRGTRIQVRAPITGKAT